MLKVVGASWVKTRISTYIIFGTCCLAICAFFISDIERPQFDGTYCATAFWNYKSGFHVEFWGQQMDLENIPKGVGRICYRDTIFENGWAQIEIETQKEYPDEIQAYAAGILEGALTWSNIYSHWSNTIESFCEESEANQRYCKWLRSFLLTNYDSIMAAAKTSDANHNADHYYYQVRLFYYQLEGIEFGFQKGVKRARSDWEIPFEDFLLMNSWSDLKDLRVYYENYVMKDVEDLVKEEIKDVRGSMMIRVLPTNGTVKVMLGHSTAGSYSTMIRILKKYRLRYHISADNKSPLVPGVDMVFTGYPGIVSSTDDFYIISGDHMRLTVGGVEMKYKNMTLWENVDFENSVLLSARVMTSNRLSHSGRSWARIMSRHPDSGSKQWIVIDMKRFQHINVENWTIVSNEDDSSDPSQNDTNEDESKLILKFYKGTFWVVDQIPGRLHAEDETEEIFKHGFWTSNGLPYFDEIHNLSGLAVARRSFSQNLQHNITDLSDIRKFFKKYAFRGDLAPEDEKSAVGNIDLKLFIENNNGDSIFQAISGPLFYDSPQQKSKQTNLPLLQRLTTDDNSEIFHPRKISVREDIFTSPDITKSRPFRWSSSNLDVDHFGQPDIWNFDMYTPKWAWVRASKPKAI